jgi:putative salt-induced outer membrane protein YdiY
MWYRILIGLVGLMLFVQSGYADEIVLKNGDRLTGKIVHLVDGKLVFKSDVAGEVTVELSNIQTFSSAEPVTVNLKDSTGFTQKVLSAEAGRFAVQGTEDLKAQQFAVADIVSINPPPKPTPKWTGDVSVGITSTHGNTKTEMISANANATKRTENDRTTVSADYAKGEQEDPDTGETVTIEDWWRAKGKYDYFFSKKGYGYLDVRYEKDAVAELDRRVIVGVGGGYQWIESDDMNFSTEFGLASLYEKFDNQTDSNSELSFQVGYLFDKKLRKNVKFTHDLTYYPSIDKFSDYYLTTTAGIRADFTEKIFMTLKAIFNYDATPAIGRGSTDTKYFLGLGYRF